MSPAKDTKGAKVTKGAKAREGAKVRKAIIIGAIIVAGLGVAARWYLLRQQPVRVGSVDLGVLPRGIAPSDLNLLIITLDTTRADRIGAYGEASRVTPTLDRLASEGVLFENAVAPAPLTLPAHSTLFTGVDPPFHGVRDNGGYILDAMRVTLAERLKEQGFATGAFVGAFVLDSKFGLDQGFDEYYDQFDINRRPGQGFALGDIARLGSEVVDAALPWLEQHGAQPFFAWLHFYDPHSPYEAPEPWRTKFANRPYLGEIAYVDAQIARVVAWLEQRALLDRTVIAVLGDHGESLGEHGESTHGLFIYQASLRVPMIIRSPYVGLKGRRVGAVARTQDVMPTVLSLMGLTATATVRGTSLVPLMAGASADLNLDAYSESIYAWNHFGWAELRAFRAGRYKFIDAPRPELYDLELDPDEQINVYDQRRPLAERLRLEIRRVSQEAESGGRSAPAAIDPETRERLAALGYVGTFTEAALPAGAALADPKDKIEIFNLLLDAREDRNRDPIAMLEKIVAEDPQIIDAWTRLGNEYFRRKQYARAVPYYKKALELRPGYDLATINLANAYRQMGNPEAAMLGYQQYLEKDPRNAYVRYQLGEIQSDLGQLEAAAETFSQALRADPALASARNALGVVRFKQGKAAEAVQEIRAAIAAKPDVRLAHFNLAVIAESDGKADEARRLYLKEIELHPTNYRAHFNLGRLYEAAGDREQQIASWKTALEANDAFPEGHILLAKLYLDLGRDLEQARRLAERGVELAPQGRLAALGRAVAAEVELRRARRLEKK